jgi:SSS family solute:Na+ symporter
VRSIDVGVLLLYLGGIVAVGLWTTRRRRTSDEFMSAGGRLPGWAVGLSIFGTYVSSISFLALPSKAYSGDWNAFVFSLAIPVTAWAATRSFVPFYRTGGEISSYAHLERRFAPWARIYAVVCYLLTQLARTGTIMYLLALALAPLTGWSVPLLILMTGAVAIAYTLYGGIEAVIWTDVVQSVVFIVGAAACAGVLLFGLPEGPSQLFRLAAAHHKFSLGSTALDPGQSTIWVVFLYGLFINLQNFGIDQTYVQRYRTARSLGDARRSVWTGALLYLPISAIFFFIGTGLFAFYDARPNLLPASVADRPDTVFPFFIVRQLPAGLVGLVIASIFAAAQSTISSSMNSSATLLCCDVYERFRRGRVDERARLRVLRAATLLMGGAGTAMALAMMRMRSALDAWWQLAGIFSGGMLGLFLLGYLSRRPRSWHAAAGVAAGVAVILWMTFFRTPFHSNLIIVLGTVAVILVGFLLSILDRASRA